MNLVDRGGFITLGRVPYQEPITSPDQWQQIMNPQPQPPQYWSGGVGPTIITPPKPTADPGAGKQWELQFPGTKSQRWVAVPIVSSNQNTFVPPVAEQSGAKKWLPVVAVIGVLAYLGFR